MVIVREMRKIKEIVGCERLVYPANESRKSRNRLIDENMKKDDFSTTQ